MRPCLKNSKQKMSQFLSGKAQSQTRLCLVVPMLIIKAAFHRLAPIHTRKHAYSWPTVKSLRSCAVDQLWRSKDSLSGLSTFYPPSYFTRPSLHKCSYSFPAAQRSQARFPLRVPAMAAPSTVKGPDYILWGSSLYRKHT